KDQDHAPDRGQHVHHQQDQRADRARPGEAVLGGGPERGQVDDVDRDREGHDGGGGGGGGAVAGGPAQAAVPARVPGQRVHQPGRPHGGGQAAAERADRGAQRDDVSEP